MAKNTIHFGMVSLVACFSIGCVTDFSPADTATDDGLNDTLTDSNDTIASDGCAETEWYYDEDNDGFGVVTENICAASAPIGYVDQGGDCCPTNSDVHPDQTAFFAIPYNCPELSFDYDCDGAETQEFDLEICPDLEETCTSMPDWDTCDAVGCCYLTDALPQCGDAALISRCGWTTGGGCVLAATEWRGCMGYNGGGEQFIQCR